jgi:DNA-binding MarR family transcriptional regulator
VENPAGSTDLAVLDNRELIAAAKREMATAPVNDSALTSKFIEKLNTLRDFAEGMNRGIEQFTYLKSSEHLVLTTIAKDISHPRHIGRRIGMEKDAVSVILQALEEKGFVHVAERIGDRIIDVTITDNGHAALAQTEAVQFRSMDAILQQAPARDVQRLLSLLDEATSLASSLAVSIVEPEL